MPYAKRDCSVCGSLFEPIRPSRANSLSQQLRCHQCRKAADSEVRLSNDPAPLPAPDTINNSAGSDMLPPIVQGVFDLETFSLHRNWGVLMVGSIMIHRGGPTAELTTFTLRDFSAAWPERRGDDSELAQAIAKKLDECHILYAHNGEGFDIRWMRTLALKFGFKWHEKKLVDPCRIAWKKYGLSNNSLSTLANFLDLPEQKMPVGEKVWRDALLNNDNESWSTLVERCESDVRLLNAVASRVVGDVGMITYDGSAFR